MKLGGNHIQVHLCGRVLSAQESSATKLISSGKGDFSKSKLLNSAGDENLAAVPLLAQLLLSKQGFASQRFHKMPVSVSQHLFQRRLNALAKKVGQFRAPGTVCFREVWVGGVAQGHFGCKGKISADLYLA